jgi:isocitrate dehydrogenase (NAD+)
MSHEITVIRGDGTGPELVEATMRVLEATGVQFDWDIHDAGENVMAAKGEPLPDDVVDAIKRSKVCLKGPITTPVGKGFRSVNVRLRKDLDCYANVRPARIIPGVRTRYDNVDMVVVRENIEDLYAGIEYAEGSDDVRDLIGWVKAHGGKTVREDSGVSLKPISVFGSERIVRYAFALARRMGRKKVTAVHKANIMKHTDGLFLEVARRVAAEHPDIAFEDVIVDNCCMQLVQRPEQFDVLVLPNLYGDIISDLASGLVGGLGVTPGANIGDDYAVFEAVHGSAPKYAGLDKVNPTAMLLAGVMMLDHLGESDAARRLERAVAKVIGEGRSVTYDLKPTKDDPAAVGTKAMSEAVIAALKRE